MWTQIPCVPRLMTSIHAMGESVAEEDPESVSEAVATKVSNKTKTGAKKKKKLTDRL